jgi:sugar lactone lactonase YvrE
MILLALLGCTAAPDDTATTGDTGPTYHCDAAPGVICRIAGTGDQALGADGVPALESAMYLPQDVTVGPDNALYLEDWSNHRLRRIDPDGTVDTICGQVFIGDGPEGPAENASLNHPVNIGFGPDGNLYFAAWHNSKVEKIDMATDMLTYFAGTGVRSYGGDGGPALEAILNLPSSVAWDSAGNLYLSDQANQRIRRIDGDGIITTIAGTGDKNYTGDGGPATEATLHAGSGQEATPGGRLLIKDDVIYAADTQNYVVRRIDLATGIIDTYAGNGVMGYGGDGGPATQASFGELTDLAMGLNGELYVADTTNDCIRVVYPDGTIDTFAGQCTQWGEEGDGGDPRQAKLHHPYGVSVGPEGNVYVTDTYNNVIRVVYAPE